MELKELKLGKMSTKELAAWFGVSYGSFRNKKHKALEELKEYCRYEAVYGGVKITDIYISEYVNSKTANYELVKAHVPEEWDSSGLDTKKNVSDKIYGKYKRELTIQNTTTYNYVCKASDELYGKAKDYEHGGTKGNCWYKLCIIQPDGSRRLLTTEEEQRRKEIKDKYYSIGHRQKDEEIRDALLLQKKRKEITKEAYQEAIAELEGWRVAYLLEFEETLPQDCKLGYGTFKVDY